MINLDTEAIRQSLSEAATVRLAGFEVFSEIDSTNSYLLRSQGPAPGHVHVAVTDNQTDGRGRHGRTWQSPPGSGLCLSLKYTFAQQPTNLSALTLAIGLGVINVLEKLGVDGVQLKWPNDLIANDGKLGGILTETQSQTPGAITVVTGIGLNIDLDDDFDLGDESDWAHRAMDLSGIVDHMPSCDALVAGLIDGLCTTFIDYESKGLDDFVNDWSGRDWLFGREIRIDTSQRQVTGIGAGIADDGALLVDTGEGTCSRITSGSVVMAEMRGSGK